MLDGKAKEGLTQRKEAFQRGFGVGGFAKGSKPSVYEAHRTQSPQNISGLFVFSNAGEFSAIPQGTKGIPLKLLPAPLLS